MGRIADLIKAAGARADSVNPFVLELIMAAAGEEPEKPAEPDEHAPEHEAAPPEHANIPPAEPVPEEHHDPKE